MILARSGEIVVEIRGKAISDRTLGDRVNIKNLRSKGIIQGQVIDHDQVQVTMKYNYLF